MAESESQRGHPSEQATGRVRCDRPEVFQTHGMGWDGMADGTGRTRIQAFGMAKPWEAWGGMGWDGMVSTVGTYY